MNDISFINKQRLCKINPAGIKKLAALVLKEKKVARKALTIVAVDDREICKINKEYLHRSEPTDVISFEFDGGYSKCGSTTILGDIVISTERGLKRAGEFEKEPPEEIAQYIVHGILHLLDYDDIRAVDAKKMHKEEERLLELAKKRFGQSFFNKTITER